VNEVTLGAFLVVIIMSMELRTKPTPASSHGQANGKQPRAEEVEANMDKVT
jgi:hypothetical protein